MYVTSSTGVAKRSFSEQDVINLINQKLTQSGKLAIVDNIQKRDELESPQSGTQVFVKDATGDSTVKSGGAFYLYTGDSWLKTSETESMNLALVWDSIQGGPNSTPTQIDQAVQSSHSHANKTQLDKIGEDSSGNLTYDGQLLKTCWSEVSW